MDTEVKEKIREFNNAVDLIRETCRRAQKLVRSREKVDLLSLVEITEIQTRKITGRVKIHYRIDGKPGRLTIKAEEIF